MAGDQPSGGPAVVPSHPPYAHRCEPAQSLHETYTSIAASLFKAKSEKDGDSIVKLYTAMSELREAWQTVS